MLTDYCYLYSVYNCNNVHTYIEKVIFLIKVIKGAIFHLFVLFKQSFHLLDSSKRKNVEFNRFKKYFFYMHKVYLLLN